MLDAAKLGHVPLRTQNAEPVSVREALALAELDVLRPEHLDVRSPLDGRLARPAAADDLRLPRPKMKPKSAAHLRASVNVVQQKATEPVAVPKEQAEKIFRLAAFLEAYRGLQDDIEDRRLPLD